MTDTNVLHNELCLYYAGLKNFTPLKKIKEKKIKLKNKIFINKYFILISNKRGGIP